MPHFRGGHGVGGGAVILRVPLGEKAGVERIVAAEVNGVLIRDGEWRPRGHLGLHDVAAELLGEVVGGA